MRIDPKTYSKSLEGPPPRSSRQVTDLAEWGRARLSAQALAKSCAGSPWFVSARAGLGRRGRPVVRAFLRWTPDGLPAIFPVRWDGVLVVLRLPRGRDIYMCDAVRPKAARPQTADVGPSARGTSRTSLVGTPPDSRGESPTCAHETSGEIGVRVALLEDAMSSSMVALIETLGVAGLVRVHENDFDGGAVLDIPAKDHAEAERLRRNLDAWRVIASVVPTEGR